MSQQGDPKSDSDDRYASDSQEDITSEETFHDTDDLGFENDEELGETHGKSQVSRKVDGYLIFQVPSRLGDSGQILWDT
ncbi:hypothetical protein DSO57_1019805 [Entomophthora muscae]|uniref:Uncharacterized protein n=1 Tax=Entomophthora muscae TaxID=34485 RepID=A0ACC2RIL5_9FUNG|nr:hypothetical protein DSO57_1019805 [Entomophthora muscae]